MIKQSLYNYFIPEEDRIIYFNGISNHSFSVNQEEHKRFQNLLDDPIGFEINYPSIFKKFVEWNFLRNEEDCELDWIRWNHKLSTDNKDYSLVINPTLECNFDCWYCYEEHTKGRMTTETIENVQTHIKYMIEEERITSLNLSWFGGEPLLYFEEVIYPIALYGKNICGKHNIPYSCGITTNGSKMDEDRIRKMAEIELHGFQITIDGARARHDRIRNENGLGSFDIIIQNIIDICKIISKAQVTLRVNYDQQTLKDESLSKVFDNIPFKYRKQIAVNFQRVWQTSSNKSEDTEENLPRLELSEYCKNIGYIPSGVSNVFSVGVPNLCRVDKTYHALINYDGKVYSCTARDFDEKQLFGILGENGKIVWDNKKLAKKLSKPTFENDMCLNCKYLPLCLGPCSQKIIETDKKNIDKLCPLRLTEVQPETVILNFHKEKQLRVAQKISE